MRAQKYIIFFTFVVMNEKELPEDSALRVNEGIDQPEAMNPEAARRFRDAIPKELDAEAYVNGILEGSRPLLSKAITMVESALPRHQELAREIVNACVPHAGRSVRVGITGVPGVGKSTFIETLGKYLTAQGNRIAVLAIDPSSRRTKGSILGDKTRMEDLANDPNAYIRPSSSAGTLGGVARNTRESVILCEAAGFNIIFVETVGVGQSETAVHSMVDFFLLLMLAGAGDELQGIKKGVLELADMVAVNKADGDNRPRAELAAADYRAALHLMSPASPTWSPPVVVCSGLTGDGLDALWQQVVIHRARMSATGELQERRRDQQVRWMWAMLDDRLRDDLRTDPAMGAVLDAARQRVHDDEIPATVAVDEVWRRYLECRS